MENSYIDKTGRVVISNKHFQVVKPFQEGLAPVRIKDREGFINKAGEVVIEPVFSEVYGFSDGLSCADDGNKCGFIDKTGRFVIEPVFDYETIWSFQNGLAIAGTEEDKWGYIDKTGRYVWGPTV